jgi:hypothetical protein
MKGNRSIIFSFCKDNGLPSWLIFFFRDSPQSHQANVGIVFLPGLFLV